MKTALTIAGSDCSGGAGIQGDLKTFAAHGVYGMSVITAVTAQNTTKVSHIQGLEPITISKQIEAIFDDIKVDSIKIGMLFNKRIITAIVNIFKNYQLPKIVLDPVMISTTGRILLKGDAIESIVEDMFPLCNLITPNILEAERLTDTPISNTDDMETACRKLYELGPKNILVKGGHLRDAACDVLFDGKDFTYYNHKRIDNPNTHGTGCALSSAIAANISKGQNTVDAVGMAKDYITKAIAGGFSIGSGDGPVNHFIER
ncbi:bifunctional hydroxymethylpyrimidine kinase/phosphomethylpyrimidine kinase [Vallitalea maricola]|uniref:Bifunctional hydroxymethylpyrimidine kinase/phosphomethylpyrimidine kinase n=1 Tax=Vallitalea maricola TaxID=3074433 RepID=A0ACB5URS7_9FIRM|nr:bifunctional hydroxymethylpyrimidine kinase/phosphomethylpyrimidine kinase [Vallitalea sp. AN17-2]